MSVVSEGRTQTRTRYFYDGLNRLTQVVVDLDLANTPTGATLDALGQQTVYEHDAAGCLTRLIALVRQRKSPATGVRIHRMYDSVGRVIAEIDGTGPLTETVHDATGNVVRRSAHSRS